MSGESGKYRKPIWLNFAIMALLIVTSGFTLTACQQPKPGGKTPEQLKENQPTKSDKQKSTEQLKKNQPTKSDKQKPGQKPKQGQDSTDDDDQE
jgi:hypothetical protein